MTVQTTFLTHAKPNELPVAEITEINRSGSSPSLELRVNIGGQDHDVLLPLDALHNYGVSGSEVADVIVRELPQIREALEDVKSQLLAFAARIPNR